MGKLINLKLTASFPVAAINSDTLAAFHKARDAACELLEAAGFKGVLATDRIGKQKEGD